MRRMWGQLNQGNVIENGKSMAMGLLEINGIWLVGIEVVVGKVGAVVSIYLSIYGCRQRADIKSQENLQITQGKIFRISFWFANSKGW